MSRPSFYKKGLAAFGGLLVIGAGVFYAGLRIGTSGTLIEAHYRTTQAVNVDSMGAGQSTTTNVTLTGVVVGDHVDVKVTAGDFLSTTSTGLVFGKVTEADTVQLIFRNNTSTAAFDAGMSTFSVQIWEY